MPNEKISAARHPGTRPTASPVNSPPTDITHRAIWMLAGPMIVSNISVPLVGAVDTAVVGHLPEPHHIGAVAFGALIFTFLYWGFGFLRMGTTGFIARGYGAGDTRAISNTLLRVLLLAGLLGLVMIALGRPLIAFALFLLDSSEPVEQLARDYSLIRIGSAPATLCVYVFTGLFIGMHNTRRALYLVLTLNLTNVALDLLFVPVLELGVAGVAWATLIAEYTAAITGFIMARAEIRRALSTSRWGEVLEAGALTEAHANQWKHIRAHAVPDAWVCLVHRAQRPAGGSGAGGKFHFIAPAKPHGIFAGRLRPRRRGIDRQCLRRAQSTRIQARRLVNHRVGRGLRDTDKRGLLDVRRAHHRVIHQHRCGA